ncbi:MAG: LysM peptidoglycan-binding domain-containing protein [Steroidobacteraceae bacterium]
MTRQPSKPSVKLVSLALAMAWLAGCSYNRTIELPAEQQVDESTPLDGDGNLAGTPAAVEAAIEKLDAENAQRAVTLAKERAATQSPDDLFERMRHGFSIADVDHESIDRELSWYAKHPDYLDRTFRRGERYLHHIVSEIEERKMPLELALLPVVESAFNPVAYSRSRASGLWQFIPDTGRRYGLKQNWYYDGRRDVIEATRAALDYLEFLAAEFNGDWLLAVAAYNCGEMAVVRAVRRNLEAGKPVDFFSLKLPRETRAYVPKLLAMRRMVLDPGAYGLAFTPISNEPYFAVVETDGQLDLNVASELAELPKEELLALNPAFNHWVTDPDGPHRVLVPVDRKERLAAALADLPEDKRVRVVYHRVKRGESLGAIASRYGVSVASLRSANRMRGNTIHPGQELLITSAPRGISVAAAQVDLDKDVSETPRAAAGGRHVVRRGETLWSIARRHGVSMQSLASHNGLSDAGAISVGQVLKVPAAAQLASTQPNEENLQRLTYVVRRGDTLSVIANRFRVRVQDLLGWNNLRSAHRLKAGQRLVMFVDDARRSGG